MKKKIIAASIGAGALIAFSGFAPASAAENPAELSVLHGIPDTPVDVYVNDELTLDDFQPSDLAGPLELPAGTYAVAITAPDAADASAPILGPIDLPLEAGNSYTAVAHLTEAGDPTATLFTNDISTINAGEGRLTVRHTAAAPAVDVLAGGTAVISGLTNPNEQVLNLPAGVVSAAVAATGTTEPVIGPVDVDIAEGTNTIVYAWGSLEAGNLDVAIQTIPGLHSSPDGVPAGSAGLVATNQPGAEAGLWAALIAGVSLAGVAFASIAMRKRAVKAER